MRTISALEVRAKFGQVLDEAAAGERFVVERAGAPVAAIVPLGDLAASDPAAVKARRLAAVEQLVAMRSSDRRPRPTSGEIVAMIRADREDRSR